MSDFKADFNEQSIDKLPTDSFVKKAVTLLSLIYLFKMKPSEFIDCIF